MPPFSTKADFIEHFKRCYARYLARHSCPRPSLPLPELISHMTIICQQNEVVRVSICHCNIQKLHLRALFDCLNDDQGTSIREIILNYCDLSDTMSSFIASECMRNDNIQSIELFGNHISSDSMTAWSLYVQSTSSLVRLKLGDNKITSQGIHILATALGSNSSITQLHLGGNLIGDQGVFDLCAVIPWKNQTITSLALRDNSISHTGCSPLAQLLKNPKCRITDIQLKGNQIGSAGAQLLAPSLAVNHSLKVLELHNADIGPKGASACCQFMMSNDTIHAINFNQNNIGDIGAESVANLIRMGRISTLGLSENSITYKGASALAQAFNYSNLTGIDLGGNDKVGNAGAAQIAKALKENHTITSVDLRNCGIGTKGCIQLASMLHMNARLQHLDLGSNMCKNDGAISLAKALAKNTALKRLCLTDNLIHNKGGIALAEGLKSNVTLVNLAYGGQGDKQNKVSTPIRNIIDSIVKENKLLAKSSPFNTSGHSQPALTTTDSSASLSLDQWKYDVLQNSHNHNRLLDVEDVLSRYKQARRAGGCPNWIQSAAPSTFSDDELNSKIIYLFKADLLPRKNPNYKDYVYLTDLKAVLSLHFPETTNHVSYVQLLQILFRRQQFYVHLPQNAGPSKVEHGAQVKFLQDARTSRKSTRKSHSPVKTTPQKSSRKSPSMASPHHTTPSSVTTMTDATEYSNVSSSSLFSTPELHTRGSLPSSTSSEMSFGRELHTPSPPTVLSLSFSSPSVQTQKTEKGPSSGMASKRAPKLLSELGDTTQHIYNLFSPAGGTKSMQEAFRRELKK
mmetsp:Transcript_8028/g.29835  ORF Transcript_8028/g.29835 Transcript_8028/m.29835 type:complete len:798 (-) Transcript_8028:3637-6030(-)